MSKLKTAFTGGTKEITKRSNLIRNGVICVGVTGLSVAFGVVAGAAIIPFAVGGAITCAALDGCNGAYKALKNG